MTHCARCDWQPDRDSDLPPRELLRQHALDAGHDLCCVCGVSLQPTQTQTCEQCLTTAQHRLADVRQMWDDLPSLLGRRSSSALDKGRRGGEEFTLPGGDLLVLLGPGSEGLWDDALTVKPNDPGSVAYELGWWHEEWMDTRGERATGRRPGRIGTVVYQAVAYLETRMRWAATSHLGFGEFAEDLRRMHERLQRATDQVRAAAQAGASCFDCGGILGRPVRDGLEVEGSVTCRQCRAVYSPQRYLLALAARRQQGLDGWVPYTAAATAAFRPVATLETGMPYILKSYA